MVLILKGCGWVAGPRRGRGLLSFELSQGRNWRRDDVSYIGHAGITAAAHSLYCNLKGV